LLVVRHETGPELSFLAAATATLVTHLKSFALYVLRRIRATERTVAEDRLTRTGGHDRTHLRIEVRAVLRVQRSVTIEVSADDGEALRAIRAAVAVSNQR
jgi:hypothetical protein